jgi:hypothetical protein
MLIIILLQCNLIDSYWKNMENLSSPALNVNNLENGTVQQPTGARIGHDPEASPKVFQPLFSIETGSEMFPIKRPEIKSSSENDLSKDKSLDKPSNLRLNS